MTGLEGRVARLERQLQQQQATAQAAKLSAERAVANAEEDTANGTATAEQMRHVLQPLADQLLTWLLAITPLLVALRQAGRSVYGPALALTYPPGERLSETITDHLDHLGWILKHLPDLTTDAVRLDPRLSTPQGKITAACWAFALGLPRAERARAAAWQRDEDGHWQLSPQVLTLADTVGRPVPATLPDSGTALVTNALRAAAHALDPDG